MRTLIKNYRNLTAGHCGSGAMRNLLYHYCNLELDEGVVFGLGAGLDTVFFTAKGIDPPFMLFGRGASMEADLANTLGIDYRETAQPDNDLAWQEVREEVIAGRPTMLSGDIFYLDYRDFKIHFPGHRFVLLGFDDEREQVYVADRTDVEPQTCSMGALRLSRNSPEGLSSWNTWGKFHSTVPRHSLPEACGLALHMTVQRMLGLDKSQHHAMEEFQGGLGNEVAVGLAGLRTFADQLPLWSERDNAASHAQYVENAIIKFGTGGGFFRDHFAAFIRWAKVQRPDLVNSDTVGLAEQAAAAWNDLTPTMRDLALNPETEGHWAEAREQVLDIYETEYSLFSHLADTVL
ncbi:MAG: DUF4872 domain-containing protein [Halieaceae bacterium]|jgi:hypothetical protein|nr:DUF4872 domain-containing protein [Halieaceae bacterium]